MTTERFQAKDFETVLDSVVREYGHGISWLKDGMRGGELHYHFNVKKVANTTICVDVNSTIMHNGYSADTGDNSIRAWLSDDDGSPLGNKVARWVTRQPGWQNRLTDMLFILISMGEAIEFCTKCQSMEKIFIVKKEGKNKGRLFIKCNCEGSFTWLDETDQEQQPEPVKVDVRTAPSCPKCGATMKLRNRKSDGAAFWGCSIFPACNGSRNVEIASDDNFTDEIQRRDREDEARRAEDKYVLEHSAVAPQQTVAETPAKPKAFKPSQYHLDIFDWVKNPKQGNALVIGARAGSGKTTTGVELLKLLNPSMDILFLAFNSHIVEALKAKAPSYVKVRTCHSQGFGACRDALGKSIQKDDDKERRILSHVLDRLTHGHLYSTVLKLVSLVKATLCGTTFDELNTLAEYYGVELNGDAELIFAAAGLVIEKNLEDRSCVSFDDMIWLPIMLNMPIRKYDFVFVDEAQDLNKAQIELAMRSLKPGGRIVCCGDEFQSMYGFRGADAKAIPNIISALNAKTLPLSITYRNPKSVVRLVNEKFPEIAFQAAEWAEEGEVRRISYERAMIEYADGDMVICRTNAPLVKPVFALIRRGIKATIRGRDIGKGLLSVIRKMNARDLHELIFKLTDYTKLEVDKLMTAEKSSQAQSLQDKCDTIIALCDGISTVTELENRIDAIFDETDTGVVFSSIHRCKGLEAKRVFILRPDLLPHPMACKPWEIRQERNIEYVAYTRALQMLSFVDGGL